MSDDIELPVNYERMGPPTIVITKDLARQIVALGLDGISPKTLAAIDQGMADSLSGRVTPLYVLRQIGPGIVDPWKTGMDTATYCPPGQMLCATPVDAGGEDAAVESIRLAMGTKAWDSYVDYAGNVVQLIRAGKVPGVHFNEGNGCCVSESFHNQIVIQSNGKSAEIAALRARLADAERRADEMEGKAGEWVAVDVHKERVESARADAVAMNKRLLGERDAAWKENARILARVVELENGLAAERERREKAEAKLAQSAAIDSHGNCGLSADGDGCNVMAELRAARASDYQAEKLAGLLREALWHIDTLEGHLPMINAEDENVYKESIQFGEKISAALAAYDATEGTK